MFVQGKLYRRRGLHNQYGGQSQGGISTPANQNFIFIFTGEQGEQYGYSDSWTDDGIFFYASFHLFLSASPHRSPIWK